MKRYAVRSGTLLWAEFDTYDKAAQCLAYAEQHLNRSDMRIVEQVNVQERKRGTKVNEQIISGS